MNTDCLITTKGYKNEKSKNLDILYIEDFIGFGNVNEGRTLTNEIFFSNKEFIKKYDYEGYKLTWSWYDQIYQISLKYSEIVDLIWELENKNYNLISIEGIHPLYEKVIRLYFFEKQIKTSKKINLKKNIKIFSINSILLFFTFSSLIYFSIKKKKYVAIRTEDMIYKKTQSDFRLSHLYHELKNNNIDFIEFVRSRSLKDFAKNTFRRKRFSIYYDSITYFVKLFNKKTFYKEKPKNFQESILFEYANENIILSKSIKYIKLIFRLCNIDKFVLISFGSRSASLSFAAKSLNIKIIGIMHGQSMKENMAHEFMENYNEKKYIGPDIYGVWSRDWVHYFHKFCKIVPKENIVCSGLLRPIDNYIFKNNNKFQSIDNNKIRILLLSEQAVSAKEIWPYIEQILLCNRYELSIKVRPMIKDKFYEELKDLSPMIEKLNFYEGDIFEVGKKIDIFLGTYSTAVIEASLINKISILLKTVKWGDTYNMNKIIKNENLLVDSPSEICENIEYRVKNEFKLNSINIIKNTFFGNNNDGAKWIINQILLDEN